MKTKKPSRGKRNPRRTTALPDHLIYTVCDRFLRKTVKGEDGERWTADDLADWLTDLGFQTTRAAIFPIVRQAIDKGFVVLRPPRETSLLNRLAECYPQMPSDTKILDLKPGEVVDNLTGVAAERILELIREVGARKNSLEGPADAERDRVHVGFGAGGTTLLVARRLALLMRHESGLPPLTLHAMSSGFDIHRPLSAPTSFFSYFQPLNHSIHYVGLFCPAVVRGDQYAEVRRMPDIAPCFREAEQIDIVVTSFAQADDEHGMLNRLHEVHGGDSQALIDEGHVGDVQYQPYSEAGPIQVNTGIRAVTLFELSDLVALARTPDKHVLLVAGPCITCGRSKSDALRPLLCEPSLRVCNHMIVDAKTAQELLRFHQQSLANRPDR